MEITMKEKNAISESLRAYVAKYPSQTKAAGSLKGVMRISATRCSVMSPRRSVV